MAEQTLDRVRRELEAEEQDYEEKLRQARKREERQRRLAKARVVKRLVCLFGCIRALPYFEESREAGR